MLTRPMIFALATTLCGLACAIASGEDPVGYRGHYSGGARSVNISDEQESPEPSPSTSEERVQPAAYSISDEPSPPSASRESRSAPLRLAPPDAASAREISKPKSPTATSAVTSVVGSLGVVLGVFLVIVWFSRRFKPAGAAQLPKEAVELLGRTSLSGQHSMHLLRIGGKLVLVALSPQGAHPLAEINNPAEVERLADLCRRERTDSSSASFRQLVTQIGGQRTESSFVDNPRSRTPVAATAKVRATART